MEKHPRNTPKTKIISGVLLGTCCVGGVILYYCGWHSETPTPQGTQKTQEKTASFVAPKTTPALVPSAPLTTPVIESAPQPQNEPPPTPRPKKTLQDPLARTALKMVGVDADVTEYWKDAIFNDELPKKERADLMEDLNEAGFSNPKRPTVEDLELARKRIALIEEIAPSTTDPFMQKHLEEAYKDLQTMLQRAPAE